ncbi:MAG: DUF996 domain-containing protein [Pyrobaculum sp.]|jgi:uncharacterized membrane protein
MDLELAKVLAGVGGLVAGVGVFTNWVAALIGAVLIYVGLSAYVEKLGDVVARDDAVKWLVHVVFASVAFAVAQSATGFSLLSLHAVWAIPLAGVALAVAVAAWVAGWVLQVASAYRMRRLLTLMKETTGEGLFGAANTLYWWGSALTIVLIGVVLLFAAYILIGVGFLTAKLQK